MTLFDWIALSLFFIAWLGYGPILGLIARRSGSLNDDMLVVRDSWMTAMTHREMRLIDSQLMGHSINSASFFASTNLLLIAAVAGILFGGENALKGFAAVGAEAVPMKILEAKLALVLVCLARGFLDFIWSLRQMNYALALIGAAPEIHTETDRVAYGHAVAQVLNPALGGFSQGVRGYYFALAAAAWLFGPLWLALGVISAFGLLVWRQAGSPAARAVRAARRLLERS
ncbi:MULTISPECIES: DUF599 domain-containing protein [unclassified Brevundimonas]|uniref:DUF599 domain-containing protein n=1 Tax=unclassified Brevundimonas TaxID=2622653 RepID=UPI000CFCD5FE|nr:MULTISPECIES: DUF599 family protein [unclassified Brevundimonas]PRA33320.1 hypothetical protein CQ024_04960 [Brevundimonas sp. MYb27]PQZ83841.1 hypothetical protein CQ026_03345 [Brevundimonas sp. MYb31]PRB13770.1 hypothetical protein CQ039_11535 [Brevundimonas sp. MYb52]PRB34497.1 hypothetical protein CQ035_10790 [Brevundimonas sp. MYb46]PRB53975.1 hypothetical protein CQ028_05435 [Brevundimonas sp. MYb33]